MQDIRLEFYVLNYDANAKKVVNFNIFRNYLLKERMIKELDKYVQSPNNYQHITNGIGEPKKILYGFEAFCEELKSAIMWQEWSRREYEISVADAFETDISKLEKWDCYGQAEPNIPIIAREIIYQYSVQAKKKRGKKISDEV